MDNTFQNNIAFYLLKWSLRNHQLYRWKELVIFAANWTNKPISVSHSILEYIRVFKIMLYPNIASFSVFFCNYPHDCADICRHRHLFKHNLNISISTSNHGYIHVLFTTTPRCDYLFLLEPVISARKCPPWMKIASSQCDHSARSPHIHYYIFREFTSHCRLFCVHIPPMKCLRCDLCLLSSHAKCASKSRKVYANATDRRKVARRICCVLCAMCVCVCVWFEISDMCGITYWYSVWRVVYYT